MEKIVEQGILYDFYGELLTEHQRRLYEDAVYNDLSLREIADENGISRQGVHNLLRRCDKILEGYEEKLQLVEKFIRIKKKAEEMEELSRQARTDFDSLQGNRTSSDGSWVMQRMGQLAREIIEEL